MNRIAKNATTLSTTNAIHRKASTMKCGIASNHFTSHSQRLSSGSSRPSSRTGFAVGRRGCHRCASSLALPASLTGRRRLLGPLRRTGACASRGVDVSCGLSLLGRLLFIEQAVEEAAALLLLAAVAGACFESRPPTPVPVRPQRLSVPTRSLQPDQRSLLRNRQSRLLSGDVIVIAPATRLR